MDLTLYLLTLHVDSYGRDGNVKLRVNLKKYNQTIISRILSNLVQKAKKQSKITKKQLNLAQGVQKTIKKTFWTKLDKILEMIV